MLATDHPESTRHRSRALRVALIILAFLVPVRGRAEEADRPLLGVPSPVGDLTYTPGRGARLGRTGITLGGYANVNVTRDEGGPAELVADDLSLFVSWDPVPRFHLFSELEIEDALVVDDHGHGGTDEARFTAERVYGDVLLSDALVLRVGKFLTPVGRWNVIHAQPLVWTTSRPLATTLPFDPHTTGAMLLGSVPVRTGTLAYTLYGQATDQLDPTPEPQRQDRAGGARLEYGTTTGWSVGASYLGFTHFDRWHHLGGLDAFWRRGRFELMGELTYEEVVRAPGDQWGLYVQPVIETLPRIFLVLRYEHYDQPSGPTVDLGVTGLAWRPVPYLVLKAEYLFSDRRAAESPPGFKSSVAILF
jgi:hypothetical protein